MTESSSTPDFWGWAERHKVISTVAGVALAMTLIGSVSEDLSASDAEATSDAGAADGNGAADATRPRHKARTVSAPALQEREASYVVTYVVDGDTVELGNGERVRLVGIDTPEEGECGYEKARSRLAALVEGRQVNLAASDEDRDGYGRLLRYVDLGPVDAGLQLIQEGLAVARYDSRDGYGFHPRETEYVRADRGAPDLRCG